MLKRINQSIPIVITTIIIIIVLLQLILECFLQLLILKI